MKALRHSAVTFHTEQLRRVHVCVWLLVEPTAAVVERRVDEPHELMVVEPLFVHARQIRSIDSSVSFSHSH